MKRVCTTSDCGPTTLIHDQGNAAAFNDVGMSANKSVVLKICPFCEQIPRKDPTGGYQDMDCPGKIDPGAFVRTDICSNKEISHKRSMQGRNPPTDTLSMTINENKQQTGKNLSASLFSLSQA